MGREAEAVMAEMIPGFDGIDPAYIFEPEAIAGLVIRVAKGEADAFHGRMLHVKDDLDALRAEADRLIAENRFAMVVNTLD